jgi:hypothetical protein
MNKVLSTYWNTKRSKEEPRLEDKLKRLTTLRALRREILFVAQFCKVHGNNGHDDYIYLQFVNIFHKF